MQSVGHILRETRVARGLTLEQVNARTRIPFKSLEAIEADDLTAISSAFLYKSFVRQFAQDVGLDYGQIAASVQAAVETIPAPLIPGEGESPHTPKVAALRLGRRRNSRWLYSVASFAIILLGCSAFYAAWQGARAHLNSHVNSTKALKINGKEASAPAPGVRFAKTPAAPAPPASASLKIEVSATEPAWVAAYADGKRSFTGTMERAERKTLQGRDTARITTRNAGGVKVVFNGKSLGPLGRRGQVRTVLFTKNRYRVLDTPAYTALSYLIPTALPLPGSSLLVLLPVF